MRLAFVLTKEKGWSNWISGMLPYSIGVKELASVLVDTAVNGSKKLTWEHGELRKRRGR